MTKPKKEFQYKITNDFFKDYINMILFYTWDPIRMSRFRSPLPVETSDADSDITVIRTDYYPFSYGINEDEYLSYVEGVQYHLLEGSSEMELYQYLRMLETELMDTGNAEVTKFAAQRLHKIGVEIRKYGYAKKVYKKSKK